jgi:hypothetical protein
VFPFHFKFKKRGHGDGNVDVPEPPPLEIVTLALPPIWVDQMNEGSWVGAKEGLLIELLGH